MDTVETPLAEPEESKGEKIWARVLRASLAPPRRQGGPQGLSQVPAIPLLQ